MHIYPKKGHRWSYEEVQVFYKEEGGEIPVERRKLLTNEKVEDAIEDLYKELLGRLQTFESMGVKNPRILSKRVFGGILIGSSFALMFAVCLFSDYLMLQDNPYIVVINLVLGIFAILGALAVA